MLMALNEELQFELLKSDNELNTDLEIEDVLEIEDDF